MLILPRKNCPVLSGILSPDFLRKRGLRTVFYLQIFLCLGMCSGREEQVALVTSFENSTNRNGIEAKNGALLAQDEINISGGIAGTKIKIVLFDDCNSMEKSSAVSYRLQQNNFRLAVLHSSSRLNKNLADTLKSKNILLICSSENDEESINPNLVIVAPQANARADILADYATKRHYKRVLVIPDASHQAFGESFMRYFTDAKKNIGIIERRVYKSGEDLPGIFSEAYIKSPDAVLILAETRNIAVISQFLKIRGFTKPILASNESMSDELLSIGGRHSSGIIFPDFLKNISEYDENLIFREKYILRYGEEPTFSSYMAYDSLIILKKSFSGAKTPLSETSVSSIRSIIIGKQFFETPSGKFSINNYGQCERKLSLFKTMEGHFEKILF